METGATRDIPTAKLAVGQAIPLTISDIAFGGEGVGRWEDFVVFVPFVMVGEIVEVLITEVKKRFARGHLQSVRQPSPERVSPPCPYFTGCGGCQYQHMPYEVQLATKEKQLADLFSRLGGFELGAIKTIVPSPRPYGYRNRIMVRTQWDKFKQGLNIGFLRFDNRLVIDVQECKIASPEVNELLQTARTHPPPKGGLKVLLREPVPGWEVPRDSFFQNNFFLLPALIEVAGQLLREPDGPRHLIDAYCGAGFFSIELAPLFDSVVGLEFDQRAVAAARRNALERKASQAEFLAGDVEETLPVLMQRFKPETVAILIDPPRTGCSRGFLDLLLQFLPARIVYVSCHPATLARDLRALCLEGRYQVATVVPLDMFPQTQHIECIAKLERMPNCPAENPGGR